jgi:integrase
MGVYLREKRGHLYLDYRVNGRRTWEALHLTISPNEKMNREVRDLAEIIRVKKELQIVSGENGLLDPVEGKRPLIEYAEALAEKQHVKNPLPKSLRYLREYAGNIHLGAVNERWVDGYRDFLLKREEIGDSTAGKYFSALGMVLRRAVRDSILIRNPAEAVRGISAPETQKIYFNVEELERLARTPIGGTLGAEVKRGFLFACLSGLRVSDIRALSWGNIERDPLQIVKRQAKTGRVVCIPLSETAWILINDGALHRREELVFPRLTASLANTNQYLKEWAKKAGIEKPIGWHSARHTFATLTLEGGADISTVSRMLGHTKIGTTAIYAKTTDRAKRAAVDTLPALEVEGRKA